MRVWVGVLLTLCGCGASVESTETRPSEALSVDAGPPCPAYVPPENGSTLSVQASADVTACLESLCAPVATCAGIDRAHPVCVTEVNGGELLGLYACP